MDKKSQKNVLRVLQKVARQSQCYLPKWANCPLFQEPFPLISTTESLRADAKHAPEQRK